MRSLKILSIHNRYQQHGGEDVVMQSERQLMVSFGHRVVEYVRNNEEIRNYGLRDTVTLGPRTVWAWDSYREVKRRLKTEQPDLAHFHNTLPLISPAAYYACREAGVPVVQTLHNYRLVCPAATFFRHGQVCEECMEHTLWRGVRYGCYRKSRPATAAVALMLALHRWRKTWTQQVDAYIALTQFARRKFVAAGLPAEKIAVKPNFLDPDPGPRNGDGEYALFVGKVQDEKGAGLLVDAWRRLPKKIPLRVIGDGVQRGELEAKVSRQGVSSISFEGHQGRGRVLEAMKGARFLIFPSKWYEGFPVTIVEALACGLPIVGSRLGAIQEIVDEGRTGLHFRPGDSLDLAEKVDWAWAHPERMKEMSRQARAEFEAKYTRERNYELLMEIYERAIANHEKARDIAAHSTDEEERAKPD